MIKTLLVVLGCIVITGCCSAYTEYAFGSVGSDPIIGDWNGDGADEIGFFLGGVWHLDADGDGEETGVPNDYIFYYGIPGDNPYSVDMNEDGYPEYIIFRNGEWYLDMNHNGYWDGGDISSAFGGANDIPVFADWDNDNDIDIGIFRPAWGEWYLDKNNNYQWDGVGIDYYRVIGTTDYIPCVGDWSNMGRRGVGVFYGGDWTIDYNGDLTIDGSDFTFTFGSAGDTPVVGDWDGDGADEVGVFNSSAVEFNIDYDGDRIFDGVVESVDLNLAGEYIIGDWDGDGADEVGVFNNGDWHLDFIPVEPGATGTGDYVVEDQQLPLSPVTGGLAVCIVILYSAYRRRKQP